MIWPPNPPSAKPSRGCHGPERFGTGALAALEQSLEPGAPLCSMCASVCAKEISEARRECPECSIACREAVDARNHTTSAGEHKITHLQVRACLVRIWRGREHGWRARWISWTSSEGEPLLGAEWQCRLSRMLRRSTWCGRQLHRSASC